jgi:hypothetical protein
LFEAAGHLGPVDLGLCVTGLEGSTSAAPFPSAIRDLSDLPTYNAAIYPRRMRLASAAELVGLLATLDRKRASGGEWGRVFPSQEVMVRPPEVFVRELTAQEGARLKSISKRAKYQSKRQRAMIVLASSTGMSAPQIAGLVRTDESHVRKVIHAFNAGGVRFAGPWLSGRAPEEDDA